MYLLYLDESGNEDNPDDRHFVYAGIGALERQPHWLTQRFNEVQEAHMPGRPPIPFHVNHIKAGKGIWRHVSKEARWDILRDLAEAIGKAPRDHLSLFASVIEKTSDCYGAAAVERAMQEVVKAFDLFLVREHKLHGTQHRGLLVVSQGRYDHRVKTWIREYRELGPLHNLADIPYFAPMQDSRMLQAADFVAHAVFMLYERRQPELIRPIFDRFDHQGSSLLGLSHTHPNPASACECPACTSLVKPGDWGAWVSSQGPSEPRASST